MYGASNNWRIFKIVYHQPTFSEKSHTILRQAFPTSARMMERRVQFADEQAKRVVARQYLVTVKWSVADTTRI